MVGPCGSRSLAGLVVILSAVTVAACAGTRRPPVGSQRVVRFVLDDPRSDSFAADATYRAGLVGVGWLADAANADATASRFATTAVAIAVIVPWRTLHHEFGHYRVAEQLGGDPELHWSGWNDAQVNPTLPPQVSLTAADRREFAGAGIVQSGLAANSLYRDWATRGALHHTEAIGFLAAALDLPIYAARTLVQDLHHRTDPGPNDVVAYARTTGSRVDEQELLWLSAGSVLASAPAWAALFGQLSYMRTGQRKVALPTMHFGGYEWALPFATVLPARHGPIVAVRTVIGTERSSPFEVGVAWRWQGSSTSVQCRLCDLPLGAGFVVSPALRVTASGSRFEGIATDIDLEWRCSPRWRLGGSAFWRDDDLLSEAEGYGDGVGARLWGGATF